MLKPSIIRPVFSLKNIPRSSKHFQFLLFLLLFFPFLLSAQINESDSLKLKADLTLSGVWQAGNVQTLIFRAKSDFSYKPFDKWVFKTTNSYVYQEFGNTKADEDVLSLNFLYFNPEKKLYPQLLAIASTNFRRDINLSYLLGVGGTYQVIENKDDWFKLSLSTEYEKTRFNSSTFNLSEYNGSQIINTFRATLWLNGKYHLFDKKVIINHESYFQPSLERSNNFRWRADLGLEFPLWKFLNLKVNYLHTYESIVVVNQQREDTLLTFGFTLKSY